MPSTLLWLKLCHEKWILAAINDAVADKESNDDENDDIEINFIVGGDDDERTTMLTRN